MKENVKYRFKKKYTNGGGSISEGREITYFRGGLYMDGLMIPGSFSEDIKKMMEDKDFVKEYIEEIPIIKNHVW